jgi:hypothetical protein
MKINTAKVKAVARSTAKFLDQPAQRAAVVTVATGLVGSFGLHLPAGDLAMIVSGVVVLSGWLAR